ncbi:hypothetical protein ACQJBY_045206 [Aegilops geniculata]
MAEHGEEDLAVAAAKILLSLRSRELVRWPEWIARPSDGLQRPEEEEEAELPPIPEGWPKRPRSRSRLRARAEGTAWPLSLKSPLARPGRPVLGRSGACSGEEEEEERAWSAPKAKRVSFTARRPEVPPHYFSGSAAGSGPSTSGADRARSRSRRRARLSEKASDARAESSPETPFDFANAAGSGASSSGDETARPTATQESGGGVGPSSSHEGHGSPAKRSRTDLAAGEAAAAAAKVEEQKIKEDYRDEKGHLLFDLNEAWGGN